MSLGPVQFVAISFDSLDHLRGRVLEELDRLVSSDAVRILDALFVAKDDIGDLVALELSELGEEDGDELLGMIIGELLGFSFEGDASGLSADADGSLIGVGPGDIMQIGDDIPPGSAAALLLIEHLWAADMRDAVFAAGGSLQAQGFLSPAAMVLVGAELVLIAEMLDEVLNE